MQMIKLASLSIEVKMYIFAQNWKEFLARETYENLHFSLTNRFQHFVVIESEKQIIT